MGFSPCCSRAQANGPVFDSRQKGDYVDFAIFDVKDVQPWLEPTKSFVDQIADLLTREMQ